MSHDRLCDLAEGPCCPWLDSCDCHCSCIWIEKIREDERRQAMEAVAQMDIRTMTVEESKIAALAWMDGRQTCLDYEPGSES